MTKAECVVAEALKWVGYLEKKSNSSLNDFTANAGYNNYTRFAVDYCNYFGESVNVYQAQPWCAMFVSIVYANVYGATAVSKLIGGHYAYCPYGVNNFKALGIWKTKNPIVGDVVIFKNSLGVACHTGIIRSVDSDYIYTVEGNTSAGAGVIDNGGCVAKKVYSRNYSRIMGYATPLYDKVGEPTGTTDTDLTTVTEFNAVGVADVSDYLNVRDGASTAGNKIAMFAAGDKIYITGKVNNGWYKVSIYNGGYGYVCGDYIKNILPSITEYTETADIINYLNRIGIVSEVERFIAEANNDKTGRLYWITRKIATYILSLQGKNKIISVTEYTDINNIVWDLMNRTIICDTDGYIHAVNAEPNGLLYWIARKGLQYIRERD